MILLYRALELIVSDMGEGNGMARYIMYNSCLRNGLGKKSGGPQTCTEHVCKRPTPGFDAGAPNLYWTCMQASHPRIWRRCSRHREILSIYLRFIRAKRWGSIFCSVLLHISVHIVIVHIFYILSTFCSGCCQWTCMLIRYGFIRVDYVYLLPEPC